MTWAAVVAVLIAAPDSLRGFRPSAWFGEHVREQCWSDGVRVIGNVSGDFDPKKPTLLVVYATPNGNTIEQTLGCAKREGLDWHFDIQHVAAQVRRLREVTPAKNIVLACLEADGLSWPSWKRKRANGPARIREIVEELRCWIPGADSRVALAGHSGGGSFMFGLLDSSERIPHYVERLVFLDANYSYSDAARHGDKLHEWLKDAGPRRLVVLAYDDRNVTLNGKRVVGPDGGTFRATERMAARFGKEVVFTESPGGPVRARTALEGRLALIVHANPENRILHTALVGEMNGLLHALSDSADWRLLAGPRADARWVQPAPGIPPRPRDAVGGKAFIQSIEGLAPAKREEAIAREILRGNVPESLRKFRPITATSKDSTGKQHTIRYEVMPDYLAVGSDHDCVLMPMTPATAARIAEAFGCALPTKQIVDDVYQAASVKLSPIPLTKDREAPATFLQHHLLIEQQSERRAMSELVAGIKKDVVVSNRLLEKPSRVAIYGWHKLEGKAIQPLTIVHSERYVDYSHGVRLLNRSVVVDGKPMDIRQVLLSPDLVPLLSDEGPILRPNY